MLTLWGGIALAILAAAGQAGAASPPTEANLIAVLSGDSQPEEKAIACKQLAIHGSSNAVAELAKLLSDRQLASWSRIALEAIPGPESAGALRQAAENQHGNLQVGAINSLGVRKDQQSVALLATLLGNQDQQVASAAAVALGAIGGTKATDSLLVGMQSARSNLKSAIAEGLMLCAEGMLQDGLRSEAAQTYRKVRKSQPPKQQMLMAVRGEILALGPQGVPLLLEQLHATDIDQFRLALSTARELPGSEVDQVLAAELRQLNPQRSALVIGVMADRTQGENLAVILRAAQQGPLQVRAAAIQAIAEIGNATCLPVLLEIVTTNEADLAKLAQEAIATLPGEDVDAKVLSLLAGAESRQLPVLLECVGRRRIQSTAVQNYLDHSSQHVRNAALLALGQTIESDHLPLLISHAVSPPHPEDSEPARQALLAASVRMPNREATAAVLSNAFANAGSNETKVALLNVLGQVGGEQALQTLGAAARGDDPALVDAATRLLGKWMTADAAPLLLELASTLPAGKFQVRALRAYVRIARQLPMPEAGRAEMCRHAMKLATRAPEQELVLDVLKRHPSQQALQLANEAANLPGLSDAARKTAESISQSLAEAQKQ